jgi:hypothetical protein
MKGSEEGGRRDGRIRGDEGEHLPRTVRMQDKEHTNRVFIYTCWKPLDCTSEYGPSNIAAAHLKRRCSIAIYLFFLKKISEI